MPPEIPLEVMGKIGRAERHFAAAEIDVESIITQLVSSPTVSRRAYFKLSSSAHAAVDHAMQAARSDAEAAVKLAYVRGARQNDGDFLLSRDDEAEVEALQVEAQGNISLAHVTVDRRLYEVMRRIQLVNLAAADPRTSLHATLEKQGTLSRRPLSLQQHARAALASTSASAFMRGVRRTASPAL